MDRDELLARVKARGRHLRRRRQATQAGAALAAVIMVAVAVPRMIGHDEGTTIAAGGGVSMTTEEVSTSTAVEPPTTIDAATTPERNPTTTAPATTTTSTVRTTTTGLLVTTTALVCRNSENPVCGAFYWDPRPSNDPMKITVSVRPTAPKAGEDITFDVSVTDDAPIIREPSCLYWQAMYGDGSSYPAEPCYHYDYGCPARYGPWDPPEKRSDRWDLSLTHKYESSGDYQVRFRFTSDSACGEPYGSQNETVLSLHVDP